MTYPATHGVPFAINCGRSGWATGLMADPTLRHFLYDHT